MKISISLLLIFSLVAPFTVFAQLSLDTWENLPTVEQYKNIKKQEVWLTLNSRDKVTGILYTVTDEAVILLPKDDYIDRYSHFVKLVKEDQIDLKIDCHSQCSNQKRKCKKRLFIWDGYWCSHGACNWRG